MKLLLGLIVLAALSAGDIYGQIAVKGKTVYTSAGEPISNGIVLIKDGKIERVGAQNRINVPRNYTVYEAEVVTPGLIDVHSVVGLAGYFNVPADQDQLETSDPIQPELRAIDAYNAREALVEYLRSMGVTTIHTGHGPGAIISGQTMITKTVGETVEESLLDSTHALAITLGESVSRNFQKPGTRSKTVAMLRQELIKAQEYIAKERSPKNLKMEALADLLEGKIKALITAHRASDIMTALRLQKEFGFSMILDGASEAYIVLEQIKETGVAVAVHPSMIRTGGESQNASLETAALLQENQIPFAFQSGFEAYVPKTRVVLFEGAIAAANGLTFIQALNALTINAAKILGIEKRVGSIEQGKDADIVLFSGDPFEYTTNVTGVIVNGKPVSGTLAGGK